MVVPSANSRDLLKEHAWYEYNGRKEFQSVLDFDYVFAKQDSIAVSGPSISFQSSMSIQSAGFLVALAAVLYLVTKVNKRLWRGSMPQNQQYDDYHHASPSPSRNYLLSSPDLQQWDLEAAPGLSYSAESTPTTSPHLSRDQLQLQTYSFENYYPSHSNKSYLSQR